MEKIDMRELDKITYDLEGVRVGLVVKGDHVQAERLTKLIARLDKVRLPDKAEKANSHIPEPYRSAIKDVKEEPCESK